MDVPHIHLCAKVWPYNHTGESMRSDPGQNRDTDSPEKPTSAPMYVCMQRGVRLHFWFMNYAKNDAHWETWPHSPCMVSIWGQTPLIQKRRCCVEITVMDRAKRRRKNEESRRKRRALLTGIAVGQGVQIA